LVFQEIKVIMNQRPVELTEEWASSWSNKTSYLQYHQVKGIIPKFQLLSNAFPPGKVNFILYQQDSCH
jgi:hypothetical protein